MVRYIFVLFFCLLLFKAADAQKDTKLYYLKNSGKLVSTKDSADFLLAILPPDTGVDKNLFIVKEFYSDGKIRLIGNSTTSSINLKFKGSQITFFPNGRKMRIRNFKNGEPVGDVVEYYSNGKIYNIKSYTRDKKVFFKQCYDSTGNVLAENGNGKWINFLDENFNKNAYVKGQVNNGIEEGEWRGELNNVYFAWINQKGKIVSSSSILKKTESDKSGDEAVFKPIDIVPEFPEGLMAFNRFLGRNIHYPAIARENNTQGKVIISFIIEKDGTLSDIKVARGIGDGCDEEALRVMKLSPPWKPGIQNGNAVRVAYSIPISFTLSN